MRLGDDDRHRQRVDPDGDYHAAGEPVGVPHGEADVIRSIIVENVQRVGDVCKVPVAEIPGVVGDAAVIVPRVVSPELQFLARIDDAFGGVRHRSWPREEADVEQDVVAIHADVADAPAGITQVIRSGVGIPLVGELVARAIRVAAVARVPVVVQVIVAVRFFEVEPLVCLVVVVRNVLVNVPDEQPLSGEVGVVIELLPVLEQEVFACVGPVSRNRQFQDFAVARGGFEPHVKQVARYQQRLKPPHFRLREGAQVHRRLAVVGPGAGSHDAPVANALRGVVRIIEVGQPQFVAELVHPDPERSLLAAGVFELGHLRYFADAVVTVVGADAQPGPVDGPDVVAVAARLLAGATVHRHHRVVVAEVDVIVGRRDGVSDEIGIFAAPVSGVTVECVGAEDFAREGQVAARVLVVVIPHRVAVAECQLLEPVAVMRTVVAGVVEVGQDNCDLDGAGRGRGCRRQREEGECAERK